MLLLEPDKATLRNRVLKPLKTIADREKELGRSLTEDELKATVESLDDHTMVDQTHIKLELYFEEHIPKDKAIKAIDEHLREFFGKAYNGNYCEMFNTFEEGDSNAKV